MAPSNKNDELISMEEGRSNIIVNLQQTTVCHTESRPPSDTNIMCASLTNKFQSLEDAAISEDKPGNDKPKVGKRPPKIQKASNMLRRDEKIGKHFEPRMVSIGPLHHGDKFKLAEKLKLKLAALFIEEHQLDKVCLYNEINKQIGILRKCYIEEDVKFNNEDLAWMFLVDGCALIHYMDCYSNEKLRDLEIKMDMEAFAQQDLFLLENQLPYQLLDPVLITSIPAKKQDAVRESIRKFVDKIARNIRGSSDDVYASLGKYIRRFIHRIMNWGSQSSSSTPSPQPSLPTSSTPSPQPPLPTSSTPSPQPPLPTSSTPSPQPPLPNPDPAHLLELLWTNLVGQSDNPSSSPSAPDNNRYSFRNVNELKAAWIQFKSNTSGSLKDIAFEHSHYWFTGTLKLPSLTVDDSTEPMFLNLIAFEMCPDFENDFQVSSYISFLDSLIDQQDDVRDLRKAHVLYNALGSDEKVASLFNEIATDIVPNPRTYSKVKKDIQSHYKNKWNTWMGQVYHDHFSSPWTIVAFVGAVAALVMSGLQTWYTIHSPSKS